MGDDFGGVLPGRGRSIPIRRTGLLPVAALLALFGGFLAPSRAGWSAAALAGAGVLLWIALLTPSARIGGLAALLLLAGAGWHSDSSPLSFGPPLGERLRFRGTVAEDPSAGRLGPRLLVDLEAAAAGAAGPWEPSSGRLLLQVLGAPLPAPARGDRVVFRARARRAEGLRNPGGEGYAAYLARKGVGGRASARWPGAVAFVAPGPGAPSWLRWRQWTSAELARAVPGQGGAVLRALSLGDRSGISPDTRETFRSAGTSHLLAISGLHLGVLALLLTPLLHRLLARIPGLALRHPVPPFARALTLPALIGYAGLSGFQASTLRALVMAGLLLAGMALSRPTSPLTLLAATALLLGIADPGALGDPGVHLSLAALGGLFWLAPRLERRITPAPTPLSALEVPGPARRAARRAAHMGRKGFVAGAAATLATTPILFLHFGGASMAGLLLNALAVPIVGFFCLPLTLAGILLCSVWPAGAGPLWRLAGAAAEGLMTVQAGVAAHLPVLASPLLGTPAAALGATCLVAAAGLALVGRRRARPAVVLLIAGLVLLTGPQAARWAGEHLDPRTHLWVLDVGQGQALALRFPGGRWTLVDAGGIAGSSFDVGRRVVVPALEHLGARRLWLAVSTHPHPDHLEGLASVIQWGRPTRLWLPGGFQGDPRYEAAEVAAQRVGSEVRWVGSDGASEVVDGVRVAASWVPATRENDRSLVLRVTAPGGTFLMPGDLESEGQRLLLSTGLPAACDVLVAPHHGSASALWMPFLKAVRPRVVAVSASGRPGLPAPQFEEAVQRIGAELRATYQEGFLHFATGAKP